MQTNSTGLVVLKPKTVYRDGTTHLAMSPLQFTPPVAALVSVPRRPTVELFVVLLPIDSFGTRGSGH